jgi:hypothetical protein
MSRIPTENPEKSGDQARNTLIQYSPTPILDVPDFPTDFRLTFNEAHSSVRYFSDGLLAKFDSVSVSSF